MKCRDLKYNFPDYLRNKIDDELKHQIEEHLSKCRDCADEISHLKSTIEALDDFKIPLPDEKYFINFLPKLNSKIDERSNNLRVPGWLTKFALPFTTLVFSLFLVFIVFRTDNTRSALKKNVPIFSGISELEQEILIVSPTHEMDLNAKLENNPEAQEKINQKFKETLFANNDESFSQSVDMESVISNLSDQEVTQVIDRLKEKP